MIQLLLLILVTYKVLLVSIENNNNRAIFIISSRKQKKNCSVITLRLLLTTIIVFVTIRVVNGKRRLIIHKKYDRYQRHRLLNHHQMATTTTMMMIIPKTTTFILYRFITMKRSRVNNGNNVMMMMIVPHYNHPQRISKIKSQYPSYHFTKQSIMFLSSSLSSSSSTSLHTSIENCQPNELRNNDDNNDDRNNNNNIVGCVDNQGPLKLQQQPQNQQHDKYEHHNFGFYLPYDIHKKDCIKYVVAPMVAASDYPFRSLCRQYTNNNQNILTFTQMLHAHKIITDETFCINHFDFYECYNQPQKMISSQRALFDTAATTNNNNDMQSFQQQNEHCNKGPLIVQLAGNDPKIVVKAAHKILNHVTTQQSISSSSSSTTTSVASQIRGFDLNCGCPQDIARKGNYGAHLMEKDETIVYKILTELRNSIPNDISISVKIRLPLDSKQLYNRINNILNTGIDFMTIHGRTIKENKTTVGPCHYDQIKNAIEIASTIRPNVPIIANGGIESYHDISTVQRMTGANAIMSSEALLEYPQLFNSINNNEVIMNKTPLELLNQQIQFALDYLQWCKCCPPLPGVLGNSMNIIRGHLFKLLYRYLNVTNTNNNDFQAIIQIRNQLASPQIRTIDQAQELVYRLHQFYTSVNDNEVLIAAAASKEQSWYRRHWNDNNYRNDVGIPTTKQSLSLEERKMMIKNRIAILQDQNNSNNKKTNTQNV